MRSEFVVDFAETFMKRQDISLGATPSEPTTGLPTWKRMLDLAFMLVLAPVLLTLGAGLALLVVCGSRGPVLFRQRRVGYKGREFTCYKFRTMRVDAEASPHRDHFHELMENEVPMMKLDARSDPRRFRWAPCFGSPASTELPQFINVLRGEMSIVGPAVIPYEYERYQPWQRQRCDAIPGLTGLWAGQRQEPHHL